MKINHSTIYSTISLVFSERLPSISSPIDATIFIATTIFIAATIFIVATISIAATIVVLFAHPWNQIRPHFSPSKETHPLVRVHSNRVHSNCVHSNQVGNQVREAVLCEDIVCIGVILRDSHGTAQVKSVTGNKILRILKAHGLAPEIPEDLYHFIKKAVSIRKHLERNRKDKDSKFKLILVESRIHRLARYYKKTKKVPPVWK
ncbi:40S ribosomal protein S13-like [Cucumis melo var. makuwa]|uniref:40S ribosomal protein S13-like n=1 Tax=Cucumis melo var. makuwa TaxID=1194695 RepID=A0A5A7VKU6_CUCMM|nr:40S ribosomal protein S13-like [Cucumis melo var. makuwa]